MATAAAAKKTDARPTDPIEVVEAFLAALQDLDMDAAAKFLAEDAVWHNVPFPPAEGKATVLKQFRSMNRLPNARFTVDMINIAANGSTVLTERTDGLWSGPVGGEFWVCGTFEVSDGLITLWRDRFDMATIAGKTIQGTAKNLWARLRAS